MRELAEEIIACTREGEEDDMGEWLSKHEEQADGEVKTSEVPMRDGDSACVAYTPSVDLDINYPDQNPWGEALETTLRQRLLQQDIGGVSVPARVGCDPVFADETEFANYDGEIGDPYHMAYTTICIEPVKFLKIQYQMVYRHQSREQRPFEDWLSDVSQDRVEDLREAMMSGDRTVPRPFLAFDGEGRLVNFQEGRHRGLAAWDAGMELMDVYAFANHRGRTGIPDHQFLHPPEWPK